MIKQNITLLICTKLVIHLHKSHNLNNCFKSHSLTMYMNNNMKNNAFSILTSPFAASTGNQSMSESVHAILALHTKLNTI